MAGVPLTYAALVPQVEEFKVNLNGQIHKLSLAFPADDVRNWAFIGVRAFTNSLIFTHVRLSSVFEQGEQGQAALVHILGLNDITSLQYLLNNHETHSKLGFIVLCQFRLESAMRALLEAHAITPLSPVQCAVRYSLSPTG